MKQILLFSAVALSLAACGSNSSNPAAAGGVPRAGQQDAANASNFTALDSGGIQDPSGLVWDTIVTSSVTPSSVEDACAQANLVAPTTRELSRLAVYLGRGTASGFSAANASWPLTAQTFLIGSDSILDQNTVLGIDGATGEQRSISGAELTDSTQASEGLEFATICRVP